MAYTAAISVHEFHKRVTVAGALIAIGIIFGDIGTSPLYTLNAVFHGRTVTEAIALGSFSCIFWTLFFQTTLKCVIITLQADNNGEGGIFSLYALIYLPLMKQLSADQGIPKYATNLVYLTTSSSHKYIEKKIIDSILHGLPKRADAYWFIHVNVLDAPYAMRYKADTIIRNDVYYIEFDLGFRVEPRIDYFFRQVVQELIKTGELDLSDRSERPYQQQAFGDFKFVVGEPFLSYDNDLPFWKNLIMKSYFNLKHLGVKESVNFGLDPSNLVQEKYALVVNPVQSFKLQRNK